MEYMSVSVNLTAVSIRMPRHRQRERIFKLESEIMTEALTALLLLTSKIEFRMIRE